MVINGILKKERTSLVDSHAVRDIFHLKSAVRPKTGIIRATMDSLGQQGLEWCIVRRLRIQNKPNQIKPNQSNRNQTKPTKPKTPWKSIRASRTHIHKSTMKLCVQALLLETLSWDPLLETGCLVNKYWDSLPGEERLLGETVLLGAGGQEGFSPNLQKYNWNY